MIGSLSGKVTFKSDKFLLLDTGGVGYKVNVAPETLTFAKLDGNLSLFTHTQVREDSIELYGFKTREELEFFEMLITVSGIGPKGALTVMGVAGVATLRQAISTGDTSYLTKISGIGKKTAERMVIELRDKVGKSEGTSLQGDLDAMEALKALGYSQAEAREALKQTKSADTNSKIREALKILGGK